MKGELIRLVRYAFDAKGRRTLTKEDIVRTISFERGWLPPGLVRLAVDQAVERGLLERSGEEGLLLGFETEGVRLPFDYAPDAAAVESELASAPVTAPQSGAVPLFRRIVRRIASTTDQSDAHVVAAINQQQATMGGLLTAEVAALVYGRLQGVDIDGFVDEAERHLVSVV